MIPTDARPESSEALKRSVIAFPGVPRLVSAFTVGARRSCSDCQSSTTSSTVLWVTWRCGPPSAFITYTSKSPSRLLESAICFPSGDQIAGPSTALSSLTIFGWSRSHWSGAWPVMS